MRWLKIFALSLLLTLCLFVLLLFFLPNLLRSPVQAGLPVLLNVAGLQHSRVEVQSLSWQHIKIQSLSFHLANQTRIYTQKLHWHFSFWELLSGRLGEVDVAHIRMQLAPASAVKKKPLAVLPLPTYDYKIPILNQLFKGYIKQASIQQIVFTHPNFNANLQLRLNAQSMHLQGTLHSLQEDKSVNVAVDLSAQGKLQARIYAKQQDYFSLHADIAQNRQQTHISLTQNVPDFAPLMAYLPTALQPFAQAFKTQQLKAQLVLANKGQFPHSVSGQMQAQLVSTSAEFDAQNRWHSGSLQLRVKKSSTQPHVHFTLLAPTPLTASVQPAHTALKNMRITLGGIKNKRLLSGLCEVSFSRCQAEGALHLTAHKQHNRLALTLKPEVHWQALSGWQVKLPARLSAHLQLEGVPIRQTELQGTLQAGMDLHQRWRLSLPQGVQQSVQMRAVKGWQSKQPINLNWLHGWQGTGQLNKPLASEFSELHVQLKPMWFEQPAQRAKLHLDKLAMQCQVSGWRLHKQLECSLDAGIKTSHYGQWPVPDLALKSDIIYQYGKAKVQAVGKLTGVNKQLTLNYKLSHKLTEEQGNVQLHLEDMSLKLADLNLQELKNLSKLNILNGYLNGQGWINYQKQEEKWQITPDIMLTINQLAGVYDNSSVFEDWNLHLTLHRPEHKDYLLAANLRGSEFNPGVKIQQLLASGQMQVPEDLQSFQLKVHQVNAHLLAGRIYTPPFVYASSKKVNSIAVVAEGLSLAQIAQLSKGTELSATGTLDGAIPMILDAQGINVPNAKLFARAPGGLVQFKSSAGQSLKQSNAVVGIAINALENFHYNQLNIEANYQPTGDILANLKFAGFNPTFFDGQATNLNINLTSNLHNLLESARIADNLIENIEDKYGQK